MTRGQEEGGTRKGATRRGAAKEKPAARLTISPTKPSSFIPAQSIALLLKEKGKGDEVSEGQGKGPTWRRATRRGAAKEKPAARLTISPTKPSSFIPAQSIAHKEKGKGMRSLKDRATRREVKRQEDK